MARESNPVLLVYEPNYSVTECYRHFDPAINNFPYYVFVNVLELLKYYFQLIRTISSPLKFKNNIFLGGEDVTDLFRDSFYIELGLPATLTTLAFKSAFKTIIETIPINIFYIPFENNPWEKMLYLARRESDNNFKIWGYQHATLQPGAANYFLSQYEVENGLIPDKILTSGETTFQILKKYKHYKNIPLIASCALRYSYLKNLNIEELKESPSPLKLLVILDGVEGTHHILKLLQDYLHDGITSGIEITIRPHPNYSFERAKSKFNFDGNVFNKYTSFSHQSLQNDLLNHQIILYSGSTVSIEAANLGKALINYSYGFFNFDPLSELSIFKWNITNSNEFSMAIQSYRQLQIDQINKFADELRKYVQRYFITCSDEKYRIFSSIEYRK